jgi:hypothetical protein
MIIKVRIDVTKIEKHRLYKGEKGTYLDVSLLENRDGEDAYGNHFMCVQDVSQVERMAGKKGKILGNAKIMKPKAAGAKPVATAPGDAPASGDAPQSDDVPF